MSSEFDKLNRQIEFIDTHVGGTMESTLKKTEEEYETQKSVLNQYSNPRIELLSSIKEDNGKKYYNSDYRINNYPTIINKERNISNPTIYPKEYDQYIEYLDKKNINSIDNQVVQHSQCINIDSASRNIKSTMHTYDVITLKKHSIQINNGKKYLKILIDKNYLINFNAGDKIVLQGYTPYIKKYDFLNIYIEKNRRIVFDIVPNYDNEIPYHNSIIDISCHSSDLSISSIINGIHKVSIDNNKFYIVVPVMPYMETTKFTINCTIKFFNIGNYPINLINATCPKSTYNLNEYLIIEDVVDHGIIIKLKYKMSLTKSILFDNVFGEWISDSIFNTGSDTIQIAIIKTFLKGWETPNYYTIPLEKRIDNIVCIKMMSSEIPNTTNLISDNKNICSNNKLYWENLFEKTNELCIPLGNYSVEELKNEIEKQSVKIYDNYKTELKISISIGKSETIINSYTTYKIYNYFHRTYKIHNDLYIECFHLNHHLQINDVITIVDSDKKYMNDNHKIVNILDENNYVLCIKNICVEHVINDTVIMVTTLIKKNSFRLFFDKTDTVGEVLGFTKIGQHGSITKYSDAENDYSINNNDEYIFDSKNLQIANCMSVENVKPSIINNRYILIKSNTQGDVLNKAYSSNNTNYFYKIQLSKKVGKMMFNTFVDNPIYFNPPLKNLDELNFEFVLENGEPVNFYLLNHSFTLEIMYISNYPDNTNLSTFVSRV